MLVKTSNIQIYIYQNVTPEQSCLSLQLCVRRAAYRSPYEERVLSETRLLWSVKTSKLKHKTHWFPVFSVSIDCVLVCIIM